MTPADLSRTVVRAVRHAVERRELPREAAVGRVLERVVVQPTRPGGVGDYATPVAFGLAKVLGGSPGPRDVAEVLARRLGREPGIRSVAVTGGGFLNFFLAPDAGLVDAVRGAGPRYGYGDALAGRRVPVPEGPEPRARMYGEAVAALVRAQGGEPEAGGPAPAPLRRGDRDAAERFGGGAVRWAVLDTPSGETPDFHPVLLRQHEDNPFFRVRYAHARARALLRNAADLGFGPAGIAPPAATAPPAAPAPAAAGGVGTAAGTAPPAAAGTAAPTPLDPALTRALAEYPLVLEAAAHHRAPDRLTRHLATLADALLDAQHDVLPRGDEKPSVAHRSRLALAEAAGTVLAGGLSLLGLDAPEFL
ncbi:ArgS-related anticodon-binding protein NrtL [Streptomyces sp. NRRL S-87]|uniref:ArgS-related anticodon-binding protein NrtL n=1 Tax=Streptomyces sp. NRRL S-87 TaxID=1463920 RepID=UPI0004BED596|nr:DALR anticodon-binding domain-containing protein [Streptomyces sp. NRRL S-87]